jgi:hypothetical protein
MRWISRILIIAVLSSSGASECYAQAVFTEIGPGGTVPDDDINGPLNEYLYKNAKGKFTLLWNGTGQADYTWNGIRNKDKLKFLAYGVVTDKSGSSVPKGQKYRIWLYEGYDGRNRWFLAFGVDELTEPETRKMTYALYFSFQDPRKGGTLTRWRFPQGTNRKLVRPGPPRKGPV